MNYEILPTVEEKKNYRNDSKEQQQRRRKTIAQTTSTNFWKKKITGRRTQNAPCKAGSGLIKYGGRSVGQSVSGVKSNAG